DRAQFAGPYADECHWLDRIGGGDEVEIFAGAAAVPEGDARRMQEALPRVRPQVVSEQLPVSTAPEAVAASLLFVGPARGKVGSRGQLVVNDRAIAQLRANHAIAIRAQLSEQAIQSVPVDDT